MAYTLTQARPLLTAAELELFEQSRTEPVKRLTPASLAGAIKRTRTLRDKSRDLYRRQTVSVRSDTPGAVTGDDNERTQRKADILQEVLERYEARATLLSDRGDSKSKTDVKAIAKNGANGAKVSAASGKAAAKADADPSSMKKDRSSAAPRKTAKSAAAAPAAQAGVKANKASKDISADESTAKAPKPAKSVASGKKSPALVQPSTVSRAGVGASTDTEVAPKPTKAGSAPARSSKAPSRKAPAANNKASAPDVNAPLDTVPAAKRASPLKQDAGNKAIHAHQSSQGRRTQGKRDSR